MPFEQKISALGLRAEEVDIMQDILPAAVVAALIGSATSLLTLEVKTIIQRNTEKKDIYFLRLEKIYYPFYKNIIMYYNPNNNEILHDEEIAVKIIEDVIFDNISYLSKESQKEFSSFYYYFITCKSKGTLTKNWDNIENKFQTVAKMILDEHKKISRKLKLEQPADII